MQFKIVRHRDQQGIYHEGNTLQLLRRVREVTPDSQKAAGGRQVRPRGTRTSYCPTRALTPGERRRERDRMTSQLRHAAPPEFESCQRLLEQHGRQKADDQGD